MKIKKIVIGIIIGFPFLIGVIYLTPLNRQLGVYSTIPTQDEQIAYLKKHEKEMNDGVKGWNTKIESVQWQWDTVTVRQIGNGTPQGGGWMLTIDGKFNKIKDSKFQIGFELATEKSFPNMNNFYQMHGFKIDGGSKPFE